MGAGAGLEARAGRALGERLSARSFLREAPWAALTVVWFALCAVFGTGLALGFGFALYEAVGGPPPGGSISGLYQGLVLAVFGAAVIRECRRSIPRSDAWLVDHGRGRLVSRDDVGALWRIEPGRDSAPFLAVEVFDATPRPDGSRERHILRVAPHVWTARGAVAWTFGFERASEYDPLVEA